MLRQQREHFLPLKVIKGRLEEEGIDGIDGVDDDTFDADALVAKAAPNADTMGNRAPAP